MSDYETTQEGDEYRSFGDGWGGGAGGDGGGDSGYDWGNFAGAGVTQWSDPAQQSGGGYTPSRSGGNQSQTWAPPTQKEDDYWTLSAKAAANRNQGGSSGAAYGGYYRNAIPFQTLKAPTAPQFTAIPYEPPAEDKDLGKKTSAQESAPGLRLARQQTQNAIMASRNMENPNARGKVTEGAIQGYGNAVEGITARGHAAGRAEAARKRSEQLNLYNSKYQAMSAENMTNYQNKLNQMMMDWGESVAKRNAEYNNPVGTMVPGRQSTTKTGTYRPGLNY